ncbi:MAG: hypothetical protein IPJ98_05720 [Bryobacterales bacterium]|nr:hypothetical protein [Bryobacterales bacterium]
MPAKTLHIYMADQSWAVQRGRDANGACPDAKAGSAQIVIHGSDGRILEHRSRGMLKIQNPPGKSRIGAGRIAKAVGKVDWKKALREERRRVASRLKATYSSIVI